jgi:hypothetical protein
MPERRGTHRRLNESLVYRRLAADVLAEAPTCVVCGGPATEIHAIGGDCCMDGLGLEDVEPICRHDHDATGCTASRPTRVERALRYLF